MIIDKNLLDRSIFDIIVNKVLHSPWNFAECTGAEDVEDSSSFYMIISDENGICSPLYDLICLPLIVACAKNNIKITVNSSTFRIITVDKFNELLIAEE